MGRGLKPDGFLLDMGISPLVADALAERGYHVIHIRDVGLARANDPTIVALASEENLVIITTDTDLATVVALAGRGRPSVITLRLENPNARQQRDSVTGLVDAVGLAVLDSVLITVEPGRFRTRTIPLHST